jgi:hypothetical protein
MYRLGRPRDDAFRTGQDGLAKTAPGGTVCRSFSSRRWIGGRRALSVIDASRTATIAVWRVVA